MPNPSYYFTLFKKFQVMDHVQHEESHGATPADGGFDLKDPDSVFQSSPSPVRGRRLHLTSTTPAHSPLWAVLNARAMGAPGFDPVDVFDPVSGESESWPAMPASDTPAWMDFQVNAPPPKVVDVFRNWIMAGKTDDVPDDVLDNKMPAAAITKELDPGVSLFVCSMPDDDGVRPGAVPANFWATSLIFLVDPQTGIIATPSQLASSSEYYLTAVIGNRGNAAGGRYMDTVPPAPPAPVIEAAGWVMVWNTGMSPAVQLPALSNLDVDSKEGIYDVYFLKPGQYDVVGFRLDVQTVFEGLVKAIEASGIDLGGLSAVEWLHTQGTHLCAKVLVRTENESWPALGDTPLTETPSVPNGNRRLAQKNLVPFAIDIAVPSPFPDPNIIWKNFMMGDVIEFASRMARFDERFGRHRLTIETKFPDDAFRLYLAIPKRSFARWSLKDSIKGFKIVDEQSLHGLKAPFPEHVILALVRKENSIEIPPLGDEFLAMSLGIEYSVKRLKVGPLGEVSVIQKTAALKIDKQKQHYEIEQVTVGGFTLSPEAYDSRQRAQKLVKTEQK